jgi:WD40 repeat protein
VKPLGRVGWLAGLAAAFSIAAAACKKDKESLVVATLSASATDTTAKNMTSVTLTITDGSHTVAKTFSLAATGIPSASPYVTFGVYVDSDIIGGVTVSAKATQEGSCVGEGGSKGTKIDAAGAEAPPVTIGMTPNEDVCPPDGGAGGAGGKAGGAGGAAAGTAGTGGTRGTAGATGLGGATGAAGTSGSPPSLARCVEINHDDTAVCGTSCTGTDDAAVFGVAFSPKNSQFFVTGGDDGRVKVWQVSGGTPTPMGKVLTGSGLGIVAFSPDGTLLAVGRVGGIEIWNVATWTLQRTLVVSYEVYGVAFSPDGTQVISIDYNSSATTGTDGALYVHAVSTVQSLHSLALTGAYALAVSPIGSAGSASVAVTTSTGNALVYALSSTGFSGPITLGVTSDGSIAEAVQFSPQGNLLAAGGDDGLLHFWSVPVSAGAAPTSPDIDVFANTVASNETYSVAFSPNNNYVALGGGGYYDATGSGSLTAWTVASPRNEVGTEYDTPNSYDVVSVAYAPDASLIVAGEGDCGCVIACRQ